MMRTKNPSKAKPATGRRRTGSEVKSKTAGAARAPLTSITPAASSKQQRCLDLLGRKDGASATELAVATDWQPHSVRGFISSVVRRKLGHTVVSSSDADGVRRYRIDSSTPRL